MRRRVPVLRAAPDTAVLDRYVGRYRIPNGLIVEVRRDGTKLTIKAGDDGGELLPQGEANFYLPAFNVWIAFQRDASGGCRSVLLVEQRIFPVCSPSYAKRLKSPRDLLKAHFIRYADSLERWRDWLELHDLKEEKLPVGTTFSESSMCLDATMAGLGVMLGWQVPTNDALRDGRLVQPFDGEFSTGFGLWFVTSVARRSHRRTTVFGNWLQAQVTQAFGPRRARFRRAD